MSAGGDQIGFADLVAQLARRYERRPAAETAIAAETKPARGRCVLVCGEPGSGKSALAAHFIEANRWCCHFLRVGHTEFTLWRDPYAFLTSLAFQLLAAYGDAIFPESAVIDVNGTVKDVKKTGSVVGVDVERLVAVPWRREHFRVDLDAKGIAGEVTGIRIGELVENYRSVPLRAFRELAWFEPLRRLRKLKPDAHVTLWVDGLDEELGGADPAGTGADRRFDTIASLLPLDSECRELGNVSVVISSRRGLHLDRFVADGAALIELNAAALESDTAAALAHVIDRELAEPQTIAALDALHWPAADLRGALLGRSEGNFLFIRQYFDALRAGYGRTLRDRGMPKGIDDIHTRILTTLVHDVPPAQRPPVLAVLEVLAVAQEPLSLHQLARFASADEAATKDALALLRPLLDETAGEAPARFSCYHKALRDCLLDPAHASAAWHVDAARAHFRIAGAYFAPDGTASKLDGYGVVHGSTHLAHGRPDGPEILLKLLHDGWRRFCREVTGSNQVFRHGLELARAHAATLAPGEACRRLVRLGLADVYIRSAESAIPDVLVEMMVRLGQVQRALAVAPDDSDPVRFARRNAAIIRGLLADPAGDVALAARLLTNAAQKLRTRPEWIEPEVSPVLEEWPLDRADALREVFPSLEVVLMSSSNRGARALAACARIRTALEPASANAYLQEAFDAAVGNGIRDGAALVARVFSAWARSDPAAARAHLERRGSFPPTRASAAAFMEIGNALDRAGSPGASINHANMLLGVPLQSGRDPLEAAAIWIQVPLQAPTICNQATAAQIVDRVRHVLAKADAARATSENRPVPAGETKLRIEIAAAERVCQRSREAEALAEAWQALLNGAAFEDDDLRRLVRLQASDNAEVLEAYLESAPESIRDALWFAVLRERVLPGNPGPAKALERAVIAAEKPKPTGWSWFFHALAGNTPLERLDHAEHYLREVGLPAFAIVRWRLSMLRRLATANYPGAGEWLAATLRQWAGPGANRNFIEEPAALLAELPVELRAAAESVLAEIPSGRQRRLLRAALASGRCLSDRSGGLADFDALAAEPPDPNDQVDVADYVVEAFVAGQCWRWDEARAKALWEDAAARLERAAPSAVGRYIHRCAMLRALRWGAPAAAAAELLEMAQPPPEPGTRTLMLPFPSASPFRVANLPEHEFLLGAALAQCATGDRQRVLDAVARPMSASARAFILPKLARAATTVALPQRMTWCQEAAAAAEHVVELPLRHLLLGAAALANVEIGAKRRGLELAARVVDSMAPHLAPGDTVIAHTYASALGRCVTAAIRCEAWASAWDWLWQGRSLGMHGFYVLLAELPGAMQAVCPITFEQFEAAEGAGRNFYVTT